jgi:hypothetical protein
MMNRIGVSPKVRELAQLLLSLEVAAEISSDAKMPATFLVSEKLRRPLSTLVGAAGFRSLLVRALTLAKREAKALDGVQINEDGSLEGLNDEVTKADAVLIAHLVGLLETFIGESLTLRLLNDIWPDLTALGMNLEGKESI